MARHRHTTDQVTTLIRPITPEAYAFCHNNPGIFWDPYGLSPCTDACDQKVRDMLHATDQAAKCWGIAGAGGGVGWGLLKRLGGWRTLGLGTIFGAVNWAGVELIGTGSAAAYWFACHAACSQVENGPPHPEWPNPL